MKSSVITIILLVFLVVPHANAQQLVTLNRDKVKTEQPSNNKAKKTASSTKQKTETKKNTSVSSKKSSTQKRRQTASTTKVATYLRINNQYGDVTDYPTSSGCYKTYYVYTDGQNYNVTMLPSWCRITNKTSNSFTLYIDSNSSFDNRSDWFMVKSDSKEVKVNLMQNGKPVSITANYNSGYITHGYYKNGIEYMKVNTTIRVGGAKNLKLLAVATIQDEYGNNVYAVSNYSNYALNDGTFYAATEFIPTNDDYNTYTIALYVPNNALRLYSKKNKLNCRLSLYCEKTGEFVSNVNYSIPFNAKCKNGKVTTKD